MCTQHSLHRGNGSEKTLEVCLSQQNMTIQTTALSRKKELKTLQQSHLQQPQQKQG
eukprot:m.82672 g.82672  ORF g.82672 m.82672 type:complete len:56 (-) comp17659_c1_seq3:58-225(-)